MLLDLIGGDLHDAIAGRCQHHAPRMAGPQQGKTLLPGNQGGHLQPGALGGGHLGATHVQAEHGRQLAANLQIRGLPAAQHIPEDFLDRIAAKGQLQLQGEHLEAGQGFFEHSLSADQAKATLPLPGEIQATGEGCWGQVMLVCKR